MAHSRTCCDWENHTLKWNLSHETWMAIIVTEKQIKNRFSLVKCNRTWIHSGPYLDNRISWGQGKGTRPMCSKRCSILRSRQSGIRWCTCLCMYKCDYSQTRCIIKQPMEAFSALLQREMSLGFILILAILYFRNGAEISTLFLWNSEFLPELKLNVTKCTLKLRIFKITLLMV